MVTGEKTVEKNYHRRRVSYTPDDITGSSILKDAYRCDIIVVGTQYSVWVAPSITELAVFRCIFKYCVQTVIVQSKIFIIPIMNDLVFLFLRDLVFTVHFLLVFTLILFRYESSIPSESFSG
jgi:hypothetical protein